MPTGVDFQEARGRQPLESDTEVGEICLDPQFFGK